MSNDDTEDTPDSLDDERKRADKAAFTRPVLPLKNGVLYPGISLPIIVSNGQGMEAVNMALSGTEKGLVVTAIKGHSQEKIDIEEDDLYGIGTRATIRHINKIENSVALTLVGMERVKINSFIKYRPYFEVKVVPHPVREDMGAEIEALQREILKIAGELRPNVATEAELPLADIVKNVQSPLHQMYLMAVLLVLDIEKEQALLEASSTMEACQLMHAYVSYEQNVQKLRDKISNQVAGDLGKEQKEYVLRRQLNEIHRELGDEEGEKEEIHRLEEKLFKAALPEKAQAEAQRQLQRLRKLPLISPEYQVIHSYLSFILELPWNQRTEDNLDLERAESILDEDHYDLKDVKDRIIEYLAVLKLNPAAKAPILCFLGPPGVGKTSLGKSLARALGRKFERISLGGMHDEAELRGHRRTYIGAMPGRILEAIRMAEVNNPLLMLDEIDKMGSDFHGDPQAALMEILDPAQNLEFHDNYLDLPFDLSRVFFIATANTTERIPRPLLDRMEVLRLAGYTDQEKIEIAKHYLLPLIFRETGLSPRQLVFKDQSEKDEVLAHIISEYTREAGVRELQRTLSKIARRVAVQIARGKMTSVEMTKELLQEYLGSKKVHLEQIRQKWGIGIATGLAWTETGGDIIYIETGLLPKRKDKLKITGHIGKIMRESATCALSYISGPSKFDLNTGIEEARESGLHIHIPAGAIAKDGPSAGVAMAVALASLYSKKPVRQDVAMTGEITLSGLILPVGGIKEKVLAAHRAGIREVVLPRSNATDLEEVPEEVRKKIKFFLADEISDVLREAIPNLLK